MNKLVGSLALLCMGLGLAYAGSPGPFTEGDDGIVSSRGLVSSGGEDGFIIALGLMSFLVSGLACVADRIRPSTLVAVFSLNFVFHALCMFMASVDTPLWGSVAAGDYLLFFGLVLPPTSLMIVWYAMHRGQV